MSNWIAFQIAGDEGVPLVFLHGLGGDAEQWRPQLDAFAMTHRAIAWDMPGYSDSAPLETMTIDRLVDSALTLFDRLSIGQAHLVGHSIGGIIAQALASRHPERLRSMTLVATGPASGKIDAAWRKRFIEERLGPLDRGASLTELAPKIVKGMIGDRADPKGLEQAVLSMATMSESSYRAAVTCLLDADPKTDLAGIDVPTLLIAGEKDPVVPLSAMTELASLIPGARLDILPGCGHLANLERPVEFNGSLNAFLQSLMVH